MNPSSNGPWTRLILVACVTVLLAACGAVRPTAPRESHDKLAQAAATIYVVRRDWHIDVGFATDELAPPLSALQQQFPGARYLLFGFGDRRYLESRNKRLPTLLAALWPGPGLILMTALTVSPARAFSDRQVIALPVSAVQLRAAQAAVWATLSTSQDNVQSDGPGPYQGSLYLSVRANYSALHTCNTWAAEILRAAGLAVHSAGVIFAGQLWRQVQRVARAGQDLPAEASDPLRP
jgi:hypothetical protein